jgi:hypothetical protein
MKKQELCIYAQQGSFVARLWYDGNKIECSPDTSELFKEAIDYLLANESVVIYSVDGDIVVEQLYGQSEKSLEVLSRYYRQSMGYTTSLLPCLDIDLVKKYSRPVAQQSCPQRCEVNESIKAEFKNDEWKSHLDEALPAPLNDSYLNAA